MSSLTHDEIAKKIRDKLDKKLKNYETKVKKNLLYNIPIDSKGEIELDLKEDGEAKRGHNAFQQDILVYEEKEARSDMCEVKVIPRVAMELSMNKVSTHTAIQYSKKASMLKSIYPYLRYILVIFGKSEIDKRVLKHGEDFDAIVTLKNDRNGWQTLAEIVRRQIRISEEIRKALFGRDRHIAIFEKKLSVKKMEE